MFILYLFDDKKCIAQIEDILELSCELKLNWASQVKLTLDAESPYIKKDILRMWRPLRITELIDGVEYELLSWVIRGVEASFTEVEIIAESWWVLLEKRLTIAAKKRTNAPLENVVKELFAEQNQKSQLPFKIDCEVWATVSLEVGEKAIFSSVLNSLVREGVDVLLIGDTLKIGKNIWRNRTEWPLYKDFRYDTTDPEGNTIDKAKLIVDAKNITNSVWTHKVDESITLFGLLEENKSNEDELTYLNEHKNQISEFTISVADTFFYDVELGDQVKVFINGYNELMQYDWAMKIVGKKYRSWDLPSIEYTVSTQRIPQEWFLWTIQKVIEKVNQK